MAAASASSGTDPAPVNGSAASTWVGVVAWGVS